VVVVLLVEPFCHQIQIQYLQWTPALQILSRRQSRLMLLVLQSCLVLVNQNHRMSRILLLPERQMLPDCLFVH
jgi:hypothetical protein